MERQVVLLFLFLLLTPFISAQEIEGWQINQPIPISTSVRFLDGPIDNATCTLTLSYNGTLVVPYRNMTFNNITYVANYTVLGSNTTNIGIYQRDITCCANSLCDTQTTYLEVNPSGNKVDGPGAFFQALFLFIGIGLCITFTILFIKIDGSDSYNDYGGLIAVNWKKYAKYSCLVLAVCTFIWINYTAWLISYYYSPTDAYSKIFYMMWAFPLRYWYIFAGISMMMFVYKIWEDMNNLLDVNRFGEA